MPAVVLSRVGARVVESGPGGGQELALGTWQRLEALPDPRSRQGRIYPLACLIAIALCAFTAAGNDRFTARSGSGSGGPARRTWPGCAPRGTRSRAGTGRRMRRRSGWSWTGLTRGRWPGSCSGRVLAAAGVLAGRPASVRGYRARHAARQAKTLARGRLRAVAVDGKTSRGARRADGTRVHLLGVAEHGGRLLDHLEVGVKHNETSHFTELLGPVDLTGAVLTYRCPPYRAGEPGLAGHRQESALHRDREAQPAAAARPGQGPALAAGPGRRRHPRQGARPRRDPHPEGRARQRPGLPARPPGHQDHPLAERHHYRQDHPPDGLRRHQPGPAPTPPRPTWPAWSASTGPSRRTTTSATSPSAKMPPPAGPAAGPSTWPPSAPPSPRPSKTPATCTSPKAAATTPPPPKPSASTGSIKTDADIHGTRRSPGVCPG